MPKHDIMLFSDDRIKLLTEHFHRHVALSLLCTWSDHSILRQLVGLNCDAIELLVLRLDPFQSIQVYPISNLSPDILPTDTSTHKTGYQV